jgi:hypothetical protein
VDGAVKETIMTRSFAVPCAPAVVAVLAAVLGACSAEPSSTGASSTGEGDTAAPTGSVEPEPTAAVFDPDEPTLPGGVRVLSQTLDGAVAVDPGRYGVRVSDSLLYQVDLPADSEVVEGTYLNPGSLGDSGANGLLWIAPAGDDTALPVNPCHDHTPTPVGPSVADLATALSNQPFLSVTRPRNVTVGGMKGQLVTATVPEDANVSACQDASVGLIAEHHSAAAGNVVRIWILDVDGARHVIHARVSTGLYDAGTNAGQHTRAMTRMVESITFTHG